MSVYDLLILQFIAHLLADYTFQDETWVKEKHEQGIRSWAMRKHGLVVFFISYL